MITFWLCYLSSVVIVGYFILKWRISTGKIMVSDIFPIILSIGIPFIGLVLIAANYFEDKEDFAIWEKKDETD